MQLQRATMMIFKECVQEGDIDLSWFCLEHAIENL